MLVEAGHFALILAFCVALLQVVLPLAGVMRNVRVWMEASRPLAITQFLMVAISFACLAHAFLHDDFSVRVVAQNANTLLPAWYKFSALWGNHEGSMLLWVLILAGWSAAVAMFSASLPLDMRARVLSVMGMVACGFYLFVLLTSNPFARSFPNVPMEGKDLNPLLQDIGLVLHPPMLYLGYVGFSVAFAFALAALWSGRLDTAWARWSRPWTNAAWVFLSIGITLGSWWAYYELGWGGWWFWDPVENASFMPWLVGTALHSLAVTEKRGLFKSWTVLLAIMAFSLSLLGTFLVRSGVLTSVHAFATDPERGLFVLAFLGIVVGGSLTLFALRAPAVSARGEFALLSRETALLGNNILLVIAMATVLLGTLYPLIISALDLGRMSVGPPYFNMTFGPLMVLLALIMGVGPLLRWRDGGSAGLRRRLVAPAAASLLAAALFPLLYGGAWHSGVALCVLIATWIVATLLTGLRERLTQRGGQHAITRLGAAYWGMFIAHLGMAFCIAGAGLTSVYSDERDVRMAAGDEVTLAGYTFGFLGTNHVDGANFSGEQGTFMVRTPAGSTVRMIAEKRDYKSQMGNVMTEAAIDPGFFRDLYVSLGEPVGGGAWAVRVHHKPFVRWLWIGGLLMGLGGIATLADRRYRGVRAAARVPPQGAALGVAGA
ncbi:MAG: heme lyase CcmF/NrfE family subunit [Gammaproteobacteria bacterium]|nr:heme lyase CcmF/NrfE family subunit [Gammaproteobacteria bacterium]